MTEYRQELNLRLTIDEIAAKIQHKVDQAALDKAADTLAEFGYVKVVRCRDCVHYKPYRTHKHGMMNRCHDEHGHTHKRDESDFCSRGDRRSE